ncbi:MAG: hypothetical protein ACOCV3_00570 [Halanaerobiales bacterium]
MFKNNSKDELPVVNNNKLSYRDIIILLGLWYLLSTIVLIINNYNIIEIIHQLEGVFAFLTLLAGRFIFFAISLFYLVSFYDFSLLKQDFKFNKIWSKILLGLSLSLFLLLLILFFINLPLSFNLNSNKFSPIFKVRGPGHFSNSLIPLFLLHIGNIPLVLAEILILSQLTFSFFKKFMGLVPAILVGALSYNLLLLNTDPISIIFNTLIAFIYLFLYWKSKSLIPPVLFGSAYYTYYILYIYGWYYPLFKQTDIVFVNFL